MITLILSCQICLKELCLVCNNTQIVAYLGKWWSVGGMQGVSWVHLRRDATSMGIPIFSFRYLRPTCYVLMLITSVYCFLNQQERREDTKFELAHFRKHKRKAYKQIPGRKTTLGIHKPDDSLKPGKDPGNKIANVISKTANLASSTKTPKVIMTIWTLLIKKCITVRH